MAPINLKISFGNGGILKTVKFETLMKVSEAHRIIEEKVLDGETGRTYGLFLTSSDDQTTGIWLEPDKSLDYYMLRDGDTLLYLNRIRNLRVRLLDGSLKTLQVDESVPLSALMLFICSKIGITNHDEYGLCREEKEEIEEAKPATGTLTLKRKPQEKERERDAKMEQLRKKLKTDDEVQWLHSTKSLRELSVLPGETVLLKRRLFYSDRNVDSRDPVQLGLLYVQARDAILDGTHPITEAMACEFAGIQCQIQFGDHSEEKHTPDIFESKEFLPKDYCKNRGIKKKILQAHMKHTGVSELDAKALYTKTARSLPTYGVTFFLVKEKQKGKNRLVPRLLGINAESIQRLDENTKESLITWPLTHVQRWKANETTFTLDFGEYSDSQYACQTMEARRIDNVLKSYIDLILKKKQAKDYFGKYGSEGEPMYIDTVGSSRANIIQHTSSNVNRIKEETFIGPQKIYADPNVSQITMGNQIVTVRNLLVTKQMGSRQQAGAATQMGVLQPTLNSDVLNQLKMKQRTLAKLLTGVNTSAFKIVGLITDAGDLDEMELKREIEILNENLPDIIAGVNKAGENDQLTDTAKSEMLKQLQELCDHLQMITTLSTQNTCQNAQEISDVATKLGNMSTKLFNTVDPAAKRRSALLMSSRKSFIEEDVAEAERDKRSLLLALGRARENLNRLLSNLHENSSTLAASDQDLLEARRKLAKKLALLNATTASLLASHADTKEIDYTGAKTATDTIIELMPKIERDAKIIASSDDSLDGDRVKENLRKLIDSVRHVLENVGSQDSEKLNDAAICLGDTSKLFYELGYCYNDAEKENEIIKLTKTVDDKTSQLLLKTNEMAMSSESGISSDVDRAGGRCIDASRRLITCAQLTAPFIHESHCQSAMLSSTNAVAESMEDLARSWKHLTTNCPKDQMQQLVQASMEVANALDALRDACNVAAMDKDLQGTETGYTGRVNKQQSLDFDAYDRDNKAENKLLKAISLAQRNAKDVLVELNQPPKDEVYKNELHNLEIDIADYLAQINAAAGSLLTLRADPTKLDSHAEESKVRVIAELLPEIVRGLKVLSYKLDPVERDRRLDDARQFCHTAIDLCDSVKRPDLQKLNDSAVRFGDNSMKILFDLNSYNEPNDEQRMTDITKNINDDAIDLLHQLHELSQTVPDHRIARDIVASSKECSDAARRLQSYAMTMSSIDDPTARKQMLNATENFERNLDSLQSCCDALDNDPTNAVRAKNLRDRINALRNLLGRLRENAANENALITAASETAGKIRSAREQDNTPARTSKTPEQLQKAATDKLARAANATAMLVVAYSDPSQPDISSATEALHQLGDLMPSILDDVKSSLPQCSSEEKSERMQAAGALCDAAVALCQAVSDADIEKLNESSLAFGDASADLLYHLNRDAKPETANKVIHTSKSIAISASDLLSCACELSDEATDPTVANDIDEAGTRCAEAAGRLLSCAKLTAPFMHDPAAYTSMLNAIKDLDSSLERLETSYAPLDNDPANILRTQKLRGKINALRNLLGQLRSNASAARSPLAAPAAEAAAAVRLAREHLKGHPKTVEVSEQSALQADAVNKIARAGAATASLLAAHSDPKQTDASSATAALQTLAQLLPGIVDDVKSSSARCPEKEKQKRMHLVGSLCDAADVLCQAVSDSDIEKLNESSLAFGDASSELAYYLNRDANPEAANKLINTSKSIAGGASDLLLDTSEFGKMVQDPIVAKNIDEAGSHCADSTGRLLTCAKLTAPFMHNPAAYTSMLNAIKDLDSSLERLEASYAPLDNDPANVERTQKLRNKINALRNLLERLRSNASAARSPLAAPAAEAAAAVRLAREHLKGHPKTVEVSEQRALQADAVNKLARAGAATASLLAAHSDPKQPDAPSATTALQTLTQLLPGIVDDVKSSSSGCPEKEKQKRMHLVGSLCDAADVLCQAVSDSDIEKLNESSLAFGDASSELAYCLNRDANPEAANKVINTSKSIAGGASDLLLDTSELSKTMEDPIVAKNIDEAGSHCADSTGRLLTSAKLTAPFMHDPAAYTSMMNAIKDLDSTLERLEASYAPLDNDPANILRTQKLRGKINALRNLLGQLRSNASAARSPLAAPAAEAAAAVRLAREHLKGHSKTVEVSEQSALQADAVNKLARAAAATASLLAAHSDPKQPDASSGTTALQTLTQLLLGIVDDVKSSSARCPEKEKQKRMHLVGSLCDAANVLCQAVSDSDIEKLNESSLAFGVASSELAYCLNRDAKPEAANKVINTSKSIADGASDLLLDTSELSKTMEDPIVAKNIDEAGSHCADSTGRLLTCAKLTAPFMHDPAAYTSMLNAIKDLDSSLERLEASYAPLDNDPANILRTQKLRGKINALRNLLGQLRSNASAARSPLAAPAAEAAAAVRLAREHLKGHPKTVGVSEQRALQADALNKLARAAAATSSLLTAHSDPKQPDDSSGTTALQTLAQLLPGIVDDVKSSLAPCPEKEKQKRMHLVGSLCDAANVLCQAVIDSDIEKLNESSLAFGNALSELAYCLNRDAKPEAANKVINTSKSIAGGASDLLLDTSELSKTMEDPIVAKNMDEAGSHCADSTGRLLTSAKLTAPFMPDPAAYTSMLNAIKDLDSSLERLEASYAPLDNDPANILRTQKLRGKINALRNLLGQLRSNASAARSPLAAPAAEAAAAVRLAREHLKGHPKTVEVSEQSALQADAVNKIARAGAATASLLAAHSDPKQTDASSATAALQTLAQLLPGIVDDVKSSSARCPEKEKQKRMHLVGSLCDAADVLCQAVSDSDIVKLNESSLAFGNALSELAYCLNRDAKPEAANKVINTSKSIAGGASDLLLDTSELSKTMEDPIVAKNIDEAGSHCADSTGRLLTCAKLTAPFMHDPAAYTSMLNAIKDLDSSLMRLETSYTPLDNDPANIERTKKLRDRINALRNLLERLRSNASAASLSLQSEDTEDLSCKNFLQKQVDLATKWLQVPCYDVKTKNRGIEAVTNLIDQANKLAEGLRNEEKEELDQLSSETKALLVPCSIKYDNEKSRQLIDKLHELKKTIEMTVINRVVEGFIDDEEPLNELTTLIEYSSVKDTVFMSKLEKSIKSLLEHLDKVTTTVRIVVIGGNRDRNIAEQLMNNASQAELLAPKLVQAAKVKLETPDNMMALEEFITISAEYSEAISRMRELCDQSVDPLDFVRTAGEVMQKMCEEANQHEPAKALTITRLANRVIQVGASESAKSDNEELSDALNKAKSRLKAVIAAPDTRKSQLPDWRATTVEILRSANEVESALNGETIFTKELDPDQPIFMAAHGLHAAVREWSARDNELVAVAKRMAVQMARLSECMRKDQKQALIDTSKSIVASSAEATRLARKLAMECTDVNLRKNLLQVCERIPTIGGQLKMLSTVKSTRFGNQGSEEDQEAMTMLVGNAQNLMQTIEEVVKAAAAASVKIRSDRGSGKLSWVRKAMYY